MTSSDPYVWSGDPANLFDLTDQVAVITGGSRGLGRQIALAFAAFGADVMIVSRSEDSCESTANEVREQTGRRAIPYACHVGKWDEVDRLVDAAYETFGRVDILVNNAGMSPLYPSPDSISEDMWEKVIAVNLKGPFRLCALIGPRMAAGLGGSIINVSTTAAVRPRPHVIPYASAKAGLEAMTIAFAKELGPKVRVNVIRPGPFLTDVSKHWNMEQFKARAAGFALERAGDPSEIVGAAVYLASRASNYTTGSVITVDGGGA